MLYPDLVGFYQELPLDVGKTMQRMAYYAPPGDSRQATAGGRKSHAIWRTASTASPVPRMRS